MWCSSSQLFVCKAFNKIDVIRYCIYDLSDKERYDLFCSALLFSQLLKNSILYIHYNLFITRFVITRFWI